MDLFFILEITLDNYINQTNVINGLINDAIGSYENSIGILDAREAYITESFTESGEVSGTWVSNEETISKIHIGHGDKFLNQAKANFNLLQTSNTSTVLAEVKHQASLQGHQDIRDLFAAAEKVKVEAHTAFLNRTNLKEDW
jgi:hypothetical protein